MQRLEAIGRLELGPPDVDVVLVASPRAARLGRGAKNALVRLDGVGCVGGVPDGDEVAGAHRLRPLTGAGAGSGRSLW